MDCWTHHSQTSDGPLDVYRTERNANVIYKRIKNYSRIQNYRNEDRFSQSKHFVFDIAGIACDRRKWIHVTGTFFAFYEGLCSTGNRYRPSCIAPIAPQRLNRLENVARRAQWKICNVFSLNTSRQAWQKKSDFFPLYYVSLST